MLASVGWLYLLVPHAVSRLAVVVRVGAFPYLTKLEDSPGLNISSRNNLHWDKFSILVYLQDLNPQLEATRYLAPPTNMIIVSTARQQFKKM